MTTESTTDRVVAFRRDFRATPTIDGFHTTLPWDRGTIINDEDQMYVDPAWKKWSPFSFDGRGLIITAKQTPPDLADVGMPYVSGVIRSEFNQRYGKWTMRAMLPSATGTFPAFWLLPLSWRWLKGEFRKSGLLLPEVDIMEAVKGVRDGRYHVTIHARGDGGEPLVAHHKEIFTEANLVGEMHDYSLEWTSESMTLLFDDVEVFTLPTPRDMHDRRECIANLAVGSSWSGDPVSSEYPAELVIESITVLAPIDPTVPPDVAAWHVELEAKAVQWEADERARKAAEKAAEDTPTPVTPVTTTRDPSRESVGAARAAMLGYGRWIAGDPDEAAKRGLDPAAMTIAIHEIEAAS